MRVKKELKCFELNFKLLRISPLGINILEQLGYGKTNSEIANKLKISRPRVSYWSKKLTEKGFIRLRVRSNFKQYELTAYGCQFLAWRVKNGSLGVKNVPYLLENYRVKYPVEYDAGRLDWEKLGNPKNWFLMGVKIGSVSVQKTTKHVIINSGELVGFDPEFLKVQAGQIIQAVKSILEGKGMILGYGIPLSKPHATKRNNGFIYKSFSPEASAFDNVSGQTTVEGVGTIDHSLDGIPHEEYFGTKNAMRHLEMPIRVENIEAKVEGLQSSLGTVVEGLNKVVDQLTRLVNLAEDQASEMKNRKRPDFYGR